MTVLVKIRMWTRLSQMPAVAHRDSLNVSGACQRGTGMAIQLVHVNMVLQWLLKVANVFRQPQNECLRRI